MPQPTLSHSDAISTETSARFGSPSQLISTGWPTNFAMITLINPLRGLSSCANSTATKTDPTRCVEKNANRYSDRQSTDLPLSSSANPSDKGIWNNRYSTEYSVVFATAIQK